MTTTQRILAASSIAALDDPISIATRSLQDIKADLAELGIDPKASIDAARKLAQERSTPAERLLARLDDADAIAAEIDALATADIGEIQANVPGGIAASMAADAKRRAGLPSNVTPLQRRGRRFWGWGGSTLGIAAGLLLFVMTRPDQLYQVDSPMSEETDDVAVFSEMTVAENAGLDRAFQAPAPSAQQAGTAAPEAEFAPDSLAAQARRKQDDALHYPKAKPVVTAQDLSRKRELSRDQESTIIAAAPLPEVPNRPAARPTPPPADPENARVAALAENLEAAKQALDELGPDAPEIVASTNFGNSPRAVLIVDPDAAPMDLKVQARTLPKGDLIDRLDEARALLGIRPVVALVTVLQGGKKVDAVITVRKRLNRTEARPAFADRGSSKSDDHDAFELITLPDKP